MRNVLVAALAAVGMATSAAAQDAPVAGIWSGFYLSGSAGINWHSGDAHHDFGHFLGSAPNPNVNWSISAPSISTDTHLSNGWVAIGAVGKNLGNGLRAELEGSYRSNAVNDFQFRVLGTTSSPMHGTVSTAALMANMLYDVRLGPVIPYFGGGVGVALHSYDDVGGHADTFRFAGFDTLTRLDEEKALFAYQGIVGLAVPLPGISGARFTAEYRYFATTDTSVKGTVTVAGAPSPVFETKVQNHNQNLLFGLIFPL